MRPLSHRRRFIPVAAIVAGAVGVTAFAFSESPVRAQSAVCGDFQKMLEERQSVVQKLNAMGKKKVHPREACAMFTKLTSNGAGAVKWLDANKDWCQVPPQFVEGFTADHEKVSKVRGQACAAAAKFAEMEKRAKEQPKQGLMGGGGLTGEYRVPRGAL